MLSAKSIKHIHRVTTMLCKERNVNRHTRLVDVEVVVEALEKIKEALDEPR